MISPSFVAENNIEIDLDAVRMLSEFIAQHPEAKADLKQVLDRHLFEKEIDSESLNLLKESLKVYLKGNDGELLLELIAVCFEEPDYLYNVEEIDIELFNLVRFFSSLYGNDLEKSCLAQIKNPNGWRVLSPKISNEILSGQWLIGLSIEKNSGEIVFLEETPLSIVQLVTYLISIVNEIPSIDRDSNISLDDVVELEESFQELKELLKNI